MRKRLLFLMILIVVMVFSLGACATEEHTHVYGEWTVEKEATCTEDGIEVRVCECGAKESRTIDALGHSFGEWTVDQPATCTKAGKKQRVCAKCGEVETKPIKATGHTEIIEEVAATCTTDGKKITKCSVCGEVLSSEVIKATGHTEGEFEVLTEATCTKKGIKVKKCTVCGEELAREEIPLIPHAYESEVLSRKTCSTVAKVRYTCSVCGDSYEEVVEDIQDVSIALVTQSSIVMGNSGKFVNGYQMTSKGGYGTITCHVTVVNVNTNSVVGSFDLDKDAGFSLTYQGAEADIKNYLAKLTLSDEVGNSTYVEINLANPGVALKSEVQVGECANMTAVDTKEYINQHGVGRYKCDKCGKIAYRDLQGKDLVLADLILSEDGTVLQGINNKKEAELLLIPATVTSYAQINDFSKKFSYGDNLKYVIDESSIASDIRLQGCPLDRLVVGANKQYLIPVVNTLKYLFFEDGLTKISDIYNVDETNETGMYCSETSIENLVIPKSVGMIHNGCFKDNSVISNVFYGGSQDDWSKITFDGAYENVLLNANIYYYSDVAPTGAGNYWHYVDGLPVIWTK